MCAWSTHVAELPADVLQVLPQRRGLLLQALHAVLVLPHLRHHTNHQGDAQTGIVLSSILHSSSGDTLILK